MKLWQDERVQDSLWDAFRLDKAVFPCVAAIVGSGGKTSLMEQLAQEGKEHHLRVAVTTTTHIRKPPGYQEVFSRMEKGTVTIFGKESGEEKISYPGDPCYNEICRQADLILVEADGSRGLPVKYPAEYEPVIPRNTSVILCVCGMSGLGKQAEQVCHRWELAQKALREYLQQEQKEQGKAQVTEELLSLLLEKGYGEPLERKYPGAAFFYCMNQSDTEKQRKAARRILAKTGRMGIVSALKRRRLAMIYLASGSAARYGSNKLLEPVEGRPLYRYGLEALRRASGQLKEAQEIDATVIVVSRYEEILQAAEEMQCVSVYNPNSSEGITASIHLGIETARRLWNGMQEEDAFLFAVADQPWLKAESVRRLAEAFYQSSHTIACLTAGVKNGNPVIFSGKYEEALMGLKGDKGGSVILKQHPKEVLKVQAAERELEDIDYRDDREKKQEGKNYV